MTAEQTNGPSVWAPLHQPVFRWLLIATTVSNFGSWMQDVGRAWLMTQLTPSPLFVALVQTAAMLAMLLFSLPAGAWADSGDRRKILFLSQAWMMLLAAAMAGATWFELMSPALLLLLTFGSAIGMAFTGPVWQAALPELVGREQLPAAVTLNGLSFNIARAAGPAIGGAIVSLAGPAPVFLLNAISFAGVMVALAVWRPDARTAPSMPEPLGLALRAGIRYASQPSPLRNVLARVLFFALPASALWALLPVVAKETGGNAAADYGLLLGLIGIGAVVTAFSFPALRRSSSDGVLIFAAAVALAIGLALAPSGFFALKATAMIVAGIGWLTALTILTLACQAATPDWVRGRALSIFLLVFAAAMAAGGTAWGGLAEAAGIRTTLAAAAVMQVVVAISSLVWPLPTAEDPEVAASSRAWPKPDVSGTPDPSRGPVYITIEYEVEADRISEFQEAMTQLGHRRRAEGSLRWALYQHAAEPGLFNETNQLATWGEHMRQRDRGSVSDAALEMRVAATLKLGTVPTVRHWFGAASPRPPLRLTSRWNHTILERT